MRPGPTYTHAMRTAGAPGLPAQALWLGGGLLAFTILVVAVPDLRIAVDAPGLRITLETAGAAALGSAALLLSVLARDGSAPRRHAFVAALVVQAGVNTAFGVLPNMFGVPDTTVATTFYPWLAARYLAGLLFVLAAVPGNRPRGSAGMFLLGTLAVVAVVEVGVATGQNRLPVPQSVRPSTSIVVDPLSLGLESFPLVLFGIGALLAGRS